MFLDESSVLDIGTSGSETKLGDQLISEAIIQDALLENGEVCLDEDAMLELLNEEILSERNIIKWDKITKRKHATNKAEIVLARENNDRDYKKLVTVYKMRKKLLARIHQKYGNKAKIRVRNNEKQHGLAKVLSKIKGNASVKKADMDDVSKKSSK